MFTRWLWHRNMEVGRQSWWSVQVANASVRRDKSGRWFHADQVVWLDVPVGVVALRVEGESSGEREEWVD